jgi:hypothetical protein
MFANIKEGPMRRVISVVGFVGMVGVLWLWVGCKNRSNHKQTPTIELPPPRDLEGVMDQFHETFDVYTDAYAA